MKKLTAGIFATLLTMVSVDGAYAAIASQGYVDDQVGEVSQTVTTLSGTVSGHTTQIGTINTNLEKKADKATTLGGYGITDAYTSAQGTALEGRVSAVEAPKAQVAADVPGPVSGGAVYTAIQGVSGDVSGVTSDVGTLKTDMAQAKEDISALETASANHVVKNEEITGGTHTKITYDAKGLVTAGANLTADDIPEIPNTKVSGLGSLATKSSVATADIASKAVTKEKLADDIVTSLGKADSALQQDSLNGYITKTAADAAYAGKTLETQVGTVSKENMGTTTATTVVAGVKEAIDAAKAADTKAGQAATAASTAQSAATAAQGEVDALEAVVNNETTGLAAAHTAIDAVEGRVTTAEGEIDDIQGQISNMATNETVKGLQTDVAGLKTSKLDKATYDSQVGTVSAGNMGTTATTVVTAIKEVAGEAEAAQSAASAADSKAQAAQSAASAADSKAQAAQETANAAIPKPSGTCAEPTSKCVLTYNNSQYAWEVIARDGEGE